MDIVTGIGLAAAACTALSYIPQAFKTIKSRKTEDISLGMYVVLIIGLALWLIYGILLQNLPLIIANIVTLLFSSTILIMKLKYH